MSYCEIEEKELKAANGFLMLFVIILLFVATTALFVYAMVEYETDSNSFLFGFGIVQFCVLLTLGCILCAGLKAVRPNEAYVFSLFGRYYGTLRKEGFWFVNPFVSANAGVRAESMFGMLAEKAAEGVTGKRGSQTRSASIRKTVSLKVQTFVNGVQKVNDKLGNPIMVGAVVVWRIADPTKAVFVVDDYKEYLSNQADSIIRNVSRLYPYDNMSDDENAEESELTLRGSALEIAKRMNAELQEKVESAGIEILDVRINQLAYAEEIASAMLQRQQAVAIIAARKKIVEGAVSMVEMALERLKEDDVVSLDEERKAQMVSNLLVVLCGNKDAQPVVNSGSIY